MPPKKCSVDHARSVASVGGENELVQQILKEIEDLRQDVIADMRMEVKLVMLQTAQKQNMMHNGTSRVTRFDDIGASWQENGSCANAESVFVVLYGWFDLHPNWAREIEEIYMEKRDWNTVNHQTGKRGDIGCIEWYIHHTKNELVKLVNARTKSMHKKRITITREKGTITLENR